MENDASIRDRLFVRAVVIDDGSTRAALLSVDQGSVGEAVRAPATPPPGRTPSRSSARV